MSKMKLRSFVPIALLSLGLLDCGPKSECRQFFALNLEQRHREFRTYPIDKQLDVYLCAMRVEPPDTSLANDIADRGSEAIPLVLARMKSVKSEVEQEILIQVMEASAERGYLRNRKDVVAEISNVIDSMKISQVRERSLESLKQIEVNSGIKPFTYVR